MYWKVIFCEMLAPACGCHSEIFYKMLSKCNTVQISLLFQDTMNHVSSTVSVIKSTSFFTISGSSSSSGLETRLAAFKNASAWNVCTHSPVPKKLWNVRWDVKCFISSAGAYQLILWLTSFACDYELHNSHLQNQVYPYLLLSKVNQSLFSQLRCL